MSQSCQLPSFHFLIISVNLVYPFLSDKYSYTFSFLLPSTPKQHILFAHLLYHPSGSSDSALMLTVCALQMFVLLLLLLLLSTLSPVHKQHQPFYHLILTTSPVLCQMAFLSQLGLGPAQGSAGFSPLTFGSPWFVCLA